MLLDDRSMRVWTIGDESAPIQLAILSNSTRKLLWFEISKMLMAVLKVNLLRYLLYFWAHCRSLCVRWHAQRGGQIGNIIPPFVSWTAGEIMFSKCPSISASVCACPGLCFLRRLIDCEFLFSCATNFTIRYEMLF